MIEAAIEIVKAVFFISGILLFIAAPYVIAIGVLVFICSLIARLFD